VNDDLDCREALELLQDFLRQELTPEVEAAVTRHLAGCRPCLRHGEFERNFLAALERAVGRDRCPEAVRERILAGLREGPRPA
jgi:anti-sigma factor (TIGR02949 family)